MLRPPEVRAHRLSDTRHMTFLLRAALVIGALSYLATLRGAPGTPTREPATAERPAQAAAKPRGPARALDTATLANLSAAWNALPEDTRQRIADEGVAELGRRIAPAPTVSRDTLAEDDRRAAWRGGDAR